MPIFSHPVVAYYRTWFTSALYPAFQLAEKIATVTGISIPLLLWALVLDYNPVNLVWQVPLSVFFALALLRTVVAPYWIHAEQEERYRNEIAFLRSQLDSSASALTLVIGFDRDDPGCYAPWSSPNSYHLRLFLINKHDSRTAQDVSVTLCKLDPSPAFFSPKTLQVLPSHSLSDNTSASTSFDLNPGDHRFICLFDIRIGKSATVPATAPDSPLTLKIDTYRMVLRITARNARVLFHEFTARLGDSISPIVDVRNQEDFSS